MGQALPRTAYDWISYEGMLLEPTSAIPDKTFYTLSIEYDNHNGVTQQTELMLTKDTNTINSKAISYNSLHSNNNLQ